MTPLRLNRVYRASNDVLSNEIDVPRYITEIINFSSSGSTAANQIYQNILFRSGADDFSMSYFIGFPPFYYGATIGPGP